MSTYISHLTHLFLNDLRTRREPWRATAGSEVQWGRPYVIQCGRIELHTLHLVSVPVPIAPALKLRPRSTARVVLLHVLIHRLPNTAADKKEETRTSSLVRRDFFGRSNGAGYRQR